LYSNCSGYGNATGSVGGNSTGRGFNGRENTYIDCKGVGVGAHTRTGTVAVGAGFNGESSTYTGCIATGVATGAGNLSGVGFFCHKARLVNCDGAGLTPNGRGAVGYRTNNSAWDAYHIIQNCRFPIGVMQGFNMLSANVEAINLGFSGVHVVSGCIISDQISSVNQMVGQSTSEDGRFRSNNITTRPIRRQMQL